MIRKTSDAVAAAGAKRISREDIIRKSTQEYLQASDWYLGDDGKRHWKRWQPDTRKVAYQKLFALRYNLPMRFSFGLLAGVIAVAIFAASVMSTGVGVLSCVLGFFGLVLVTFASAHAIVKFERRVPNPSSHETGVAMEVHGFGTFCGLFIGAILAYAISIYIG